MNVCLVGYGVVGKGVYDILTKEALGMDVLYVVRKNLEDKEGIHCPVVAFEDAIKDERIDCVIEVMGGIEKAYQIIETSLKMQKHVITANKAVISRYLKPLEALAKENHVLLRFEAAVAGALNILDPLATMATFNHIKNIKGIMNGSTNFILTKIFDEDLSLAEALEKARALGYIETGSNDDLEGLDLMRKINILSMMAYQTSIEEDALERVSLANITEAFYQFVKDKGWIMKYIASSFRKGKTIYVKLEPVIYPKNHPYQTIRDALNIIEINGEYQDTASFIGTGAGRYPTASAIVYDLLKVKEGTGYHLSYDTHYTIDQSLVKARYLVQVKDQLILTKPIYLYELLEDKTITCFARMEATYEPI